MSISELVPEMKMFRRIVDSIPSNSLDSHLIKTLYLLASRNCEVITKVCNYDRVHDGDPSPKTGKPVHTTKPYGEFMKYKVTEYYPDEKTTLKVFLIQSAIAKRSRKRLVVKNIALPISDVYEPYTLDLMKRLVAQKKRGQPDTLSFPISRFRVYDILQKWFWDGAKLKIFEPVLHPEREAGQKRFCNPLRHIRISHLDSYYGFEPRDIITYSGWSWKSGLAKMGEGSGQLDVYLHSSWKRYFKKLLKPVPS